MNMMTMGGGVSEEVQEYSRKSTFDITAAMSS